MLAQIMPTSPEVAAKAPFPTIAITGGVLASEALRNVTCIRFRWPP
ncbi:MAG: hypothetical protein WCC90_09205 [Methylocella sp.]